MFAFNGMLVFVGMPVFVKILLGQLFVAAQCYRRSRREEWISDPLRGLL
ncbi:hypothetical protein HM1_1601 [Heliomicrobium modesticaldum Ice1]|uniref:Uncharacterized protein n=1 Tax=Heliobacterium modesticaldum (strain ATCC 51547 / Ice1) TaxID=498761 RepID=B0TDD0_HELMI|nr:hypothetical protein HM1_1601 [Heliomicrobium modesticaldum Ice1]